MGQRRLDGTLGAALGPLRKYLMDKAFSLSLKITLILFLYFTLESLINYAVLRC